MTKKKSSGFSGTILKLVLLATNVFGFVENITAVVRSEACRIGKSVLVLMVLSFLLSSILICTWISLLGMLLVYYLSLHWSLLFSLSMILLLNIIFLAIIGLILSRVKNSLLSPLGRNQLRNRED
jgi:hypothetical protein